MASNISVVKCFPKNLKYIMSAVRRKEKTKRKVLRTAELILINNFEFTGKLIKNINVPQNMLITKISNLIPDKKAERTSLKVKTLKSEFNAKYNETLYNAKSIRKTAI